MDDNEVSIRYQVIALKRQLEITQRNLTVLKAQLIEQQEKVYLMDNPKPAEQPQGGGT